VKAKAILIIGMPGSGKDEFAMVAREMGIEVINMGDIVREYTSSTGVSISMSGEIASRERKINGMDIWAKRTIERVQSNFVVVEGVRNIEEIQRFRKDMVIGLVVSISSGRDTRYSRLYEEERRRPEEYRRILGQRKEGTFLGYWRGVGYSGPLHLQRLFDRCFQGKCKGISQATHNSRKFLNISCPN